MAIDGEGPDRRSWLLFRSRGAHFVFAAGLILALVCVLAFPLWQATRPPGFVYALNGIDEYSYLQYDFSLATQALTRPGQYLVTLGHRLGLSGGWLNVAYDAVTLILFPVLCRAIFARLGWSRGRATFGALAMLFLPAFLTSTNPVMAALRNWNVASGAVYWLNMPELFSPTILRSPEPQFSLTLLAAVTLLALRWRTFWPVYPAILFMYPFVGLPTAFVTVALHAHARWPLARWRTAGPLVVSALAVSVAVAVYNVLFVPAPMRPILIDSRLPLLSLTGSVALAVVAATWRRIEPALRFPALAIALAPWFASNTQLVSGVVVHPDNFEQYAGSFVVAIALVIGFADRARVRWVLLALAAALFVRSAFVTLRVNQATMARLPLTPALVTALRDDPAHTVIDDVTQASVMAMLMPRQSPTALGFQKTYTFMAGRYVPAYRCLKQRVLAERPDDAALKTTFKLVDVGYRYGGQEFIFASLGRKKVLQELQDVRPEACGHPDAAPLHYFHVAP